MSDAEIGQMRNGLGLSGNQLERYQTQRSIVIKKQADLVNCSALGSLAIEKGFETTVDKLLKELLKKAAGAVGGVLGGAAAISGGIVIGMLLSTEEVGESKEELDEFVKEQEEKKKQENGSGNNSGGDKKDKKGDSETNLPENTIDAGKKGSKAWNDAKKKIKDGKGKGVNTKTSSQKAAEELLNKARPNLEKKPTYSKEGKSGYEIHPAEPDVGNTKPHIKWWDWSNGKANGAEGHIYFDE